MAILQERVDELLVELRDLAEKGFPKAQEDWQKMYTAWGEDRIPSCCCCLSLTIYSEEQKRKGEEAAPGESSGTRPPTEEREDVTMDGDADKVESLSTRTNSNAPQKKFRMTDRMKEIVWNLVLLSNKCCELENEKKWVFCFSPENVSNKVLARWKALPSKSPSKVYGRFCIRKLLPHSLRDGCRQDKSAVMVSTL